MTHYREEFLCQYCDNCAKPVNHRGCGSKFKQIFEPILCPAILQSSHDVCSFCLDLFAKKQRHSQFCLFEKHNIQLHAAGWATSASTSVLRSLRKTKPPYIIPLGNLITELFTELKLQDVIVVPIPLGNTPAWQKWLETLQNSVSSLKGVEVIPVINREKQHSTRKSVAQIRYKIASEEYKLSENYIEFLKNRQVVLLDDNVTTGNTIIRCAEMLLSCNPSEVFPLTLDRTIGPRALQRCEIPSSLDCLYKIPITMEI
jgi:predicted amidophosphoribosyltransferase